jgi:hypothetical protein
MNIIFYHENKNLNYLNFYFRLERLFILLETGQTTFLRRSAAHQIGEIVKNHPNELEHLLLKVKNEFKNF